MKNGSRIAVTGGRDHQNQELVYRALENEDPSVVVLGCCPTGVDKYALDWCLESGTFFWLFNADWDKYGKMAGPRRNAEMIYDGEPDKLLVFQGGIGTQDCKRTAKQAGVPTKEIK